MSFFVQALRAIRQRALAAKTPELRDHAVAWLDEVSPLDPAARQLWPIAKDAFRRRRVLFQEKYPSGRKGITPFKFGEETVYDCYHAMALIQQHLEKRYQVDPNFFPRSIFGAAPSPMDDLHRRWSLPAQHVLKIIGGAAISDLLASAYNTSRPATISLAFSPQGPRAWELSYNLAGRRALKKDLQEHLKERMIQNFPILNGWKEPLRSGGLLLGHCAEARAWIRLLWLLRSGGVVWAVAATPENFGRRLPSGALVWEDLISQVIEEDFLKEFIKELPLAENETEPRTCSCKFCRNCAAAAAEICRELGCSVKDLIPILKDGNALQAFMESYLTQTRRVLLGATV